MRLILAIIILATPAAADIRCIQENLAMFGYDPGPIDGVYGRQTLDTFNRFNSDYNAGMTPLTRANSDLVCDEFTLFAKGAGGPDIPIELSPATDAPICYDNPAEGTAMTITGMVDGDPLTLTVSNRFAGAVDSLQWRGKEFINIFDHGRQISYAWFMDNTGECLNPTEPGSGVDNFKQTSTSELQSICSSAPNQLTTTTRPAYWLAPGQMGFCDNGVTAPVNTAPLSDDLLQKSITIGYGGIDNVIAFDATITLARDHTNFMVEIPTGYLTADFTQYWRFDPSSGELSPAKANDLTEPWDFVSVQTLPPILSTPDGAYAMGAYTAEDIDVYEILSYRVPNPWDHTNKWNIVAQRSPAPAGDYRFLTFVAVGTLAEVQAALTDLYRLHPGDMHPAEGFVDRADCEWIEGWAWDPDYPDQPVTIEVYLLNADGTRSLLHSRLADQYRGDLAQALGDKGEHAFSLASKSLFDQAGEYRLSVELVNPDDSLPNVSLTPSLNTVVCR